MKKAVLLIIYGLLMSFMLHAQSSPGKSPNPVATTKEETLRLKESSYSFGKIPQGRPVIHVFTIQNVGTEPLLLENVQASCGCTTPEWSRDPIAPGAEAPIKWDTMHTPKDILTKQLRSFTTTDKRKR